MTVTIECGPCASSGQWPDRDGREVKPCPFCQGEGGAELEVEGILERQLLRLLREQRQEGGAA